MDLEDPTQRLDHIRHVTMETRGEFDDVPRPATEPRDGHSDAIDVHLVYGESCSRYALRFLDDIENPCLVQPMDELDIFRRTLRREIRIHAPRITYVC